MKLEFALLTLEICGLIRPGKTNELARCSPHEKSGQIGAVMKARERLQLHARLYCLRSAVIEVDSAAIGKNEEMQEGTIKYRTISD